jgi:RNA polymerase sigma-70 factor (ECF subfamily)
MASGREPDTEQLMRAACQGNVQARGQLLQRHRDRLKRMVAIHLDRRLASRVDSSDLVQEALAEASLKLDSYLRNRPLAFYPWLRQIAEQRLIDARRRHFAGRRSVSREDPAGLPDESALELADRLLAGEAPSAGLRRSEQRAQVRRALDKLPERDRDVLVLRYLEQLTTAETAAVLGSSAGTVRVRTLRALQRLREILEHLTKPHQPEA